MSQKSGVWNGSRDSYQIQGQLGKYVVEWQRCDICIRALMSERLPVLFSFAEMSLWIRCRIAPISDRAGRLHGNSLAKKHLFHVAVVPSCVQPLVFDTALSRFLLLEQA